MFQIRTWCRSAIRGIAGRPAAVALLAIAFCAIMGLSYSSMHVIALQDGTTTKVIHTTQTDVDKLLMQQGITLAEGESYEINGVPGGTIDERTGVVRVLRNFPLRVTADGQNYILYMSHGTVADALTKADVRLGEDDTANLAMDARLFDGIDIQVQRRKVVTVTEEQIIRAPVKRVASADLLQGRSEVTKKAQDGLAEVTRKLEYVDGELVAETILSETVLREPVEGITTYGTAKAPAAAAPVSRSAQRYSRVIDVTATAYTYGESGKWGDVTATGTPVRVGSIAVDPKVIPLGTRLYIESPDGSYVYGNAVAADTGSAIKGKRIDLFMETSAQCKSFGRRPMRVYILE